MRTRLTCAAARAILASGALALGACSFAHMDRDRSTRPDTAMGTRGVILMPGETAPPMSGGGATSGSGTSSTSQGGGSSSGSSSSSQSGPAGAPAEPEARRPPPDDELTMLGGAVGESDGSTRERDIPLVGPVLTLIGYPFWINE